MLDFLMRCILFTLVEIVLSNHFRKLSCFLIKLINSLSDLFLLASKIIAASFPTTYLKSGLSAITTCRITFATSDGCSVFCCICLNDSDKLFANCLYGESPLLLLLPLDVLDVIFKFFQKFEHITPGSMSIIFIPKGSTSYCTDSDSPSKANLLA